MSERIEKAVNNHKNFYPCSAAVMCAFCDDAGMPETQARSEAMPFAGGRMGKCGAVLAAEYIIDKKYGEKAPALKQQFEERFSEKNISLMCAELKGRLTGKPLRSCRGCVTDAAEILDDILENNKLSR